MADIAIAEAARLLWKRLFVLIQWPFSTECVQIGVQACCDAGGGGAETVGIGQGDGDIDVPTLIEAAADATHRVR